MLAKSLLVTLSVLVLSSAVPAAASQSPSDPAWLTNQLANYSTKMQERIRGIGEPNGILISGAEFPFSGRLLRRPPSGGDLTSCSGVMISSRRFITAAHCVCESRGGLDYFKTKRDCVNGGAPQSQISVVALPGIGYFQTVGVPDIADEYDDDLDTISATPHALSDLAILELTDDVPGEFPVIENVDASDRLMSIGSGLFALNDDDAQNLGIKPGPYREGLATTAFVSLAPCNGKQSDIICTVYNFLDNRSTSGHAAACPGDSGGPLLQLAPNGEIQLVGITSSRLSFSQRNCTARDAAQSIYTLAASHIDWIERVLGTPSRRTSAGVKCQEAVVATRDNASGVLRSITPDRKSGRTILSFTGASLVTPQSKLVTLNPVSPSGIACRHPLDRPDLLICDPMGPQVIEIEATGDGLVQATACSVDDK